MCLSPKQKSISKSGHIELRKDDFSKQERDEYLERVHEDEQYKKEVGTHNDWVAAQKLRESSLVAHSNRARAVEIESFARKFDRAVEIERSLGNQSPGTPSRTLKPNQDLSSQKIVKRILKQYGKDSELFKYTQVILKAEGNVKMQAGSPKRCSTESPLASSSPRRKELPLTTT